MTTSIYLPDDLAEQVHGHGISISQVAQAALRKAVQAATIRDEVLTDLHAVAERLRSTIDPSAHDRRDRGLRHGITWAKEYATAGELAQLARLGDRPLVVARPHTLVNVSRTPSSRCCTHRRNSSGSTATKRVSRRCACVQGRCGPCHRRLA